MQVELLQQHPQPVRPSRKGKERDDNGPQPTDLDEKIMALRRKNAAATRPREKSERERTQLFQSQIVPTQQRPPKAPSQPPLQSSSYREKERDRELSPKASVTDVRRQISHSPHLSPPRHAQQPHIVSRSQPSSKDRDKEADHEDFSRRLRISSSPRLHHGHGNSKSPKLFDPNHDPIPSRRFGPIEDNPSDPLRDKERERERQRERDRDRDPRERELTNTTTRANPPRQLFDPRKDDPVRFSVLARPQPAQPSHAQITSLSSGVTRPIPKHPPNDHVSASSTSSYAASISSSAFTLSSTTDGSSASSVLFEGRGGQGQGNGTDDSGNSVFSIQLKKLYRALSNLETKIKQEEEGSVGSSMDDGDVGMSGIVVLRGKEREKGLIVKGKRKELTMAHVEPGEVERERWKKIINDHKELAEISHNLLEISLSPSVPASLRNIPTKYNIIVRLWTYGFHKLLESLRRASFNSPLALEHLQDFIYYAYSFYTALLEEPILNSFRSGWLEALGDLARYRMAVAAMVSGGAGASGLGAQLTSKAVFEATAGADQSPEATKETKNSNSTKSLSDHPAARIDDSPSPSIGVAAARLMDVEPEKERWRQIAREWYGSGLAEQPGTGKLHHHLGLLEREVEGEELRGCYHFIKSLTTLHPFVTSRESILPLFSQPLQARRASPDSRASELFVLLHGMLFTHIQLDSFNVTMARFIERLAIEGAEEREWLMMAVVNIGAILEYGKAGGIIRRCGGLGTKEGTNAAAGTVQAQAEMTMMRVMAKKAAAGVPGAVVRQAEEEKMDVDDDGKERDRSPVIPPAEAASDADLPPAFSYALQLTFAMLSFVLKKPMRKPSQYAVSTLNSYLTVILTFLATLVKHRSVLKLMERCIPWEEMAAFFSSVPRKVMNSQGLIVEGGKNSGSRPGEQWLMLTSGCVPPLPEDWCMRGMEWVGRKVFERGYWKSGEDRKAEMEVLSPVEECGEGTDGRIEDDDEDDNVERKSGMKCELVRRWVRIVRCAVGISDAVEGFSWVEGSREWRIEGLLQQKVQEWKEEERKKTEEEEEWRRMRRRVEEAMDIDDEEESISEESEEDDRDDSEEIRNLKAKRRYLQSLLQNSQRSLHPRPRRRQRDAPKKSTLSDFRLSIIPGYTILVVDTNILLSSLPLLSSLIESHRWTVVVPLPVITELDGLSSPNGNQPQLVEAAQTALAYVSSHLRSHALSLKVQTSRGNYLTSLSVRTEVLDFAFGGSDGAENKGRSMDDLILKAAIWQDEHWMDRSALLKGSLSTQEEGQAISGTRVVLLTLDRNLRLKARSRQLPAAGEKDLAGILAMAS